MRLGQYIYQTITLYHNGTTVPQLYHTSISKHSAQASWAHAPSAVVGTAWGAVHPILVAIVCRPPYFGRIALNCPSSAMFWSHKNLLTSILPSLGCVYANSLSMDREQRISNKGGQFFWGDNVAQKKSTCQNQIYGFHVHIRITKCQTIDTRKTLELKLICNWNLNALNPAGPREELKRSWLACS